MILVQVNVGYVAPFGFLSAFINQHVNIRRETRNNIAIESTTGHTLSFLDPPNDSQSEGKSVPLCVLSYTIE